MKQFEVKVLDEVGHLSDMAEVLAEGGINIVSISSERINNRTANLRIITSDDERTRNVLKDGGFAFTEEDIIAVRLEDKPGALFEITNKLGGAGINMTSIYVVNKSNGSTDVAINVDNFNGAMDILKDKLI